MSEKEPLIVTYDGKDEGRLQNMEMPCRVEGCKFKACCLLSQHRGIGNIQARRICREILQEHWALHHSSPEDRRNMIKKLGLTGPEWRT